MAPDTIQTMPEHREDVRARLPLDAPDDSSIQGTLRGASVLLTGGTGFLGKLMLDKLLRSCPGINKVFVLVRPKKNKDVMKRLIEQFDDPLYERLRKERPDFLEHVCVVEGDVGEIGLGLSEQDRERIINEVQFILHGAATVRFDEPLRTAVCTNVRGARDVLQLAAACRRLRAMLHISTAYSNCVERVIDERFYDVPLSGDKLIDLVETVDEKILNNITPGLIGEFPNTYVYTKLAAEDIVRKYGKGLPVAVFRPSIVIATAKEPIPGWIDNVYGPTGVVVGASMGLLHVLHANQHAVADLVPGDYVVNACLAALCRAAHTGNVAADTALIDNEAGENAQSGNDAQDPAQSGNETGDNIPIYNYVSSQQNPLTWYSFMRHNEVSGFAVPSVRAVYYYVFVMTASRARYSLLCALLHWLPAYLVDALAMMLGKKPMLKKTYTKIAKFSDVISFFACREWKIYNKNTQDLYKELNETDKVIFNFDMSQLVWKEYFRSYIRGIRYYLIKDPAETIPAGIRRYFVLRIVHYIVCAVLLYLALTFVRAVGRYVLGY